MQSPVSPTILLNLESSKLKKKDYSTFPVPCSSHKLLNRVAPPRSNENAAISEMNKLVEVYAGAKQIYDFDEGRLNAKRKLS